MYICFLKDVGDLKSGDVVSKTEYMYAAWNHSLYLGGGVSTFVQYENAKGVPIPCKLYQPSVQFIHRLRNSRFPDAL